MLTSVNILKKPSAWNLQKRRKSLHNLQENAYKWVLFKENWRPLLKKDSIGDVFHLVFQNFSEQPFHGTPLNECFHTSWKTSHETTCIIFSKTTAIMSFCNFFWKGSFAGVSLWVLENFQDSFYIEYSRMTTSAYPLYSDIKLIIDLLRRFNCFPPRKALNKCFCCFTSGTRCWMLFFSTVTKTVKEMQYLFMYLHTDGSKNCKDVKSILKRIELNFFSCSSFNPCSICTLCYQVTRLPSYYVTVTSLFKQITSIF